MHSQSHVLVLALCFLMIGCASISGESIQRETEMDLRVNSIGGGELYVPCHFGKISANCLLDTGAASGHVGYLEGNPSLEIVGKHGIRGATGTIKGCDTVEAAEVWMGPMRKNNLNVAHCSGNSTNVLGIDFLQKNPVLFDFNRKVLILTADPLSSENQPFQKSASGHFLIHVKIGNNSLLAIWDTGAGTSVIDKNILRDHPQFFKKAFAVTAIDAVGAERTLPIYKVDGLQIEGIHAPQTNFLVRDFSTTKTNVHPDVAAIIGMNVIMNYNWHFDPNTNHWKISRSSAAH